MFSVDLWYPQIAGTLAGTTISILPDCLTVINRVDPLDFTGSAEAPGENQNANRQASQTWAINLHSFWQQISIQIGETHHDLLVVKSTSWPWP